MIAETHWGIAPDGAREKHEGEKDECVKENCPKGQATTPEGRVRLAMLLLEQQGTPANAGIGAELLYSEQFKTEDWPRQGYPILWGDVQSVLYALDETRARADRFVDRLMEHRQAHSVLHERIVGMTKDLQEKDKEIAGLTSQVENLEWGFEVKRLKAELSAKATAEVSLLREIQRLEEVAQSLRLHGGEHWFVYGYQKVIDLPSGPYVDHCLICDKPKDDPSHFANGVKALSSKDVASEARLVQTRVARMLVGTGMGEATAQAVVKDLFKGTILSDTEG
jgi:hypothetical protein